MLCLTPNWNGIQLYWQLTIVIPVRPIDWTGTFLPELTLGQCFGFIWHYLGIKLVSNESSNYAKSIELVLSKLLNSALVASVGCCTLLFLADHWQETKLLLRRS